MRLPRVLNVLGPEAHMHRAVALPQINARVLNLLAPEPAIFFVRIPHGHPIERNSKSISGVAAKMFVGKEQGLLTSSQRPLHNLSRIRRCANRAAVLPDE